MARCFVYCMVFLLAACIAGCKSYSKYTIDEKPVVRMDARLLGIWKAVEDTNRLDYMLVQSSEDLLKGVEEGYNEYRQGADSFLTWEIVRGGFEEAMKTHRERKHHYYYITRMDRDGKSAHFQQWSSFLSKINGVTFINIPYRYVPFIDGKFITEKQEEGYFFVRILGMNEQANLLTIAVVKDPALRYLESSREVRARIAEKMNKPAFYSDTLHFYKVSDYHYSLNKSREIANKQR